MRWLGLIACLFLCIWPLEGFCKPEIKTLTVGKTTLAYQEFGQGETVIIMVSGLGDGKSTFTKAAQQLGTEFRVIIYDRAGYEDSPLINAPATDERANSELLQLLDGLRIKQPVILVGHSIGGIYIHAFAATHPNRVKALVFDDTRPPNFTQTCLKDLGAPCKIPKLLSLAMSGRARQEVEALDQIESEATRLKPASVPVLILSRTAPKQLEARNFEAYWARQQAQLERLYPDNRHYFAPKSGHYIHQDNRDWFVSQVINFGHELQKRDKGN